MAITKTIQKYLDAVEKKLGTQAREKTTLTYRNGSSFCLKRGDQNQTTVIDMGTLQLMTKQLERDAA